MPVTPMPRKERTAIPASGVAEPPLVTLAGVDHSGKTLQWARAGTLPYFPRALVVPFNEGQADHYGAIGGFEIVQHDGSYRDLLDAVLWATEQPDVDGYPPLVVFDGSTELNDLLNREQDLIAYRRAVRKAQERKKTEPHPDDIKIGFDQYAAIKERFLEVMNALANHRGMAITTCLMEEVTVVDSQGNPTKDTMLKWATHKSLKKKSDFAIELRERHASDGYLVAVRDPSMKMIPNGRERRIPDFTIGKFLEVTGLSESLRPRQRIVAAAPRPEAYLVEVDERQAAITAADAADEKRRGAAAAGEAPTPEQLDAEIRAAAGIRDNRDARKALLRLRSSYTPSLLATITLQGVHGPVDGDTAVQRALDAVRERGSRGQQQAPPAGEQPTEQDAAAAEQPPTSGATPPANTTNVSGYDVPPEMARMVRELTAQAIALGVTLEDHVTRILPTLGIRSLAELELPHRSPLGNWMVGQRHRVAEALAVAGLDAVARRYLAAPANKVVEDAELLAAMNGELPGDLAAAAEETTPAAEAAAAQ